MVEIEGGRRTLQRARRRRTAGTPLGRPKQLLPRKPALVAQLALLLALVLGMLWGAAPAVAQGQQSYWLGRSTGTEYVFDVPLPADFVAVITATGPQYAAFKNFPKFTTEEIDGESYSFVTTEIEWDLDKVETGAFAYRTMGKILAYPWVKVDGTSAEWKALVPHIKELSTSSGAWSAAVLKVLISPSAETPTLRAPIPPMDLARATMSRLAQTTKAGQYYSAAQVPADLRNFQAQMLAYGNAGRADPNFRKNNGSKTATDLTLDSVETLAGSEKVYRLSDTPPFFPDHALNDALNQAAQFHAEYLASIDDLSHDGPTAYVDPATGKTVNLLNPWDRSGFFGGPTNVVEAAAQAAPGNSPHNWMAGETHFRPWFNVSGHVAEIGYGAAMAPSGKWYFVAVPTVDEEMPAATPTPAATATPAAAETPASDPTPDSTPAVAPAEPVTPTAAATPAATPDVAPAAAATPSAAPAATDPAAAPQPFTFPLPAGTTLVQGQPYRSESGDHYLLFQNDGNVVVYDAADRYVWGLESETDNFSQAQRVQLQPDGNLVVSGANDAFIWSALDKDPDPSAYLTLTPEGVLRLVSGETGATLWASDGDLTPVAPAAAEPASAEDVVVSLQSYNYPDRFIRHEHLKGRIDPISTELGQKDSTFRMVAGLADASHLSLESVNFPGYYLVVEGERIVLRQAPADDVDFAANATFIKQPGLADPAWLSLESYAQMGKYVRHSGYVLYVDASDGSALFASDATFKQAAPNWQAEAESAAAPGVTLLGVQPEGASCENLGAAAGSKLFRFVNPNGIYGDQYFYYTGTADAPVEPVLHFVVKGGETFDVESPAGVQWVVKSQFGALLDTITTADESHCTQTKEFAVQVVPGSELQFADNWQTLCEEIPPSQTDGNVTVRIANQRNPAVEDYPISYFTTVIDADNPPTSVQGAAPVSSGQSADLDVAIGTRIEFRNSDGATIWAAQATDALDQCIELRPDSYSLPR